LRVPDGDRPCGGDAGLHGPVSGVDQDPADELGGALPARAEAPASAPVTVLTLEGVLDHSTSDTLEELLHGLVLEGHTRILADGAGLTHISSRGASLFFAMLRPLRLAGGDLKFCRLVDRARTVFTTLGLAELIDLDFDERDPALRAFDCPLRQEWLDALREGWVGLVSSNEYHRPTCDRVKNADPVFQVWFDTEDEAVLAGRKACPACS
jgi:anti-anti-sigma factor